MTPRECSQLRDRLARRRLEREAEERREWRRLWAPPQDSPRRQRAQDALLADPDASNRALGVVAGVSHVTVAAVRRELAAGGLLGL